MIADGPRHGLAGRVRAAVTFVLPLAGLVALWALAVRVFDVDARVFPGVGAFGAAMRALDQRGLTEPLRRYLADGRRPFLGVCIGMQVLFEGSAESPGVRGLGVLPGRVEHLLPSRDDAADQPGAVSVPPESPSRRMAR